MATKEVWIDTDLRLLPHVKVLNGRFFTGDGNADKVGVRVTDDGAPVQLSGTVKASVVKPNGVTLEISGSLSGNEAWVILPSSCYTHRGRLAVVIKLTSGGTVTTLGALEAYVYPIN